MSVEAVRAVLERSEAKGSARLVLLVIAEHMNKNGEAWPSGKLLGRECRLRHTQVQVHLGTLEESGELIRLSKAGPRGTNLYRLNLPAVCPETRTVREPGHSGPPDMDLPGFRTKTVREPGTEPKGTEKNHHSSCSEPFGSLAPRQEVGPDFLLKGGKTWRLCEEDLAAFRESFPAVDLDRELRQAASWLRANQSKRKTAGGMLRFLDGWLRRTAKDREGKKSRSVPDLRASAGNRTRSAADWLKDR